MSEEKLIRSVKSRIALKIDTWQNWEKWFNIDGSEVEGTKPENPVASNYLAKGAWTVLHAGEVAFVQVGTVPPMGSDAATGADAKVENVLYKVGDGKTAFKDLPWGAAKAADVHSWAKNDEAAFKAWLSGETKVGGNGNDKDNAVIGDPFVLQSVLTNALASINDKFVSVNQKIDNLDIPSITGLATEKYVTDADDLVKEALIGEETGEGIVSTITGASAQALAAKAVADEGVAAAKAANDWLDERKTKLDAVADWYDENKVGLDEVANDPITKDEAAEMDEDLKAELIGGDDNNTVTTIAGAAALANAAQASADLAQASADSANTKVNTLIGTETIEVPDPTDDDPDHKKTVLKDAGKSVRRIANEELAAQLIPDSAKEALDTLQEIATWIHEHPDDAAEFNRLLADLGTKKIKGEDDKEVEVALTVKEYVDKEITAANASNANALTNAIAGLDVTEVTVGANKTLTSIAEVDGKIVTSATPIAITKSQVTDFAHHHDDNYAAKEDFNEHEIKYNQHVAKAVTEDTYLLIDCGSSTENID